MWRSRFLAANRFGEAIVGAHAGITAEGDNRVIQQKVAKELLSKINKKETFKFLLGKYNPINTVKGKFGSNKWFKSLFEKRENILLFNLGMSYEIKAKIEKYEAWMFEESDNIQSLAKAYGEKIVVEKFLEKIDSSDENTKHILTKLFELFSYCKINEDIGFS